MVIATHRLRLGRSSTSGCRNRVVANGKRRSACSRVRLLLRPESLTFLDRVEERLEKLHLAADDLKTALRVEWIRRHPGVLSGESPSSGARRAWWIATSVRLAQDAPLSSAVGQVRSTYRQSWRASSLVEGIIRRAGGSEVSFDPQTKARAFADWTPSAQTPAPSAAGQTHHFSPRKV